jgi:fucose permease
MAGAHHAHFKRDRFTWAAYAMIAYYMFVPASLGPLMPFLRAELNLSYTVGGLHLSALASGGVLIGLFGVRISQRWDRRVRFWGGGALVGLGALSLALSRHPALTIASALLFGCGGALLLVTTQAMLSDRHGARRSIALTESNIAASIVAVLAPLCIGWFQSAGWGWRAALLIPIGCYALIIALFGRTALPHASSASQSGVAVGSAARLPRLFWAYWTMIFLGVAVEWCLNLWGADFLIAQVGLSQVAASTTMSLFFLSAVVGRVGASLLARIWSDRLLLWLAFGAALIGFPLYWLALAPALSIAGLLIAGLGVANFYPLMLSLALSVTPLQSDAASARIALGSGSAMLSMPLLLGWIADQVSIQQAYSIVVALLALAIAMMIIVSRRRSAQPILAGS